LHGLLDDLRGSIGERIELFSLELRAAVDATIHILVLLITAAIVAATAWIALWAVIVGLLMGAGMAWPWALLLVLAINLIAALTALFCARRLLPRLGMPATRRQLSLLPAMSTAAAPPPSP